MEEKEELFFFWLGGGIRVLGLERGILETGGELEETHWREREREWERRRETQKGPDRVRHSLTLAGCRVQFLVGPT